MEMVHVDAKNVNSYSATRVNPNEEEQGILPFGVTLKGKIAPGRPKPQSLIHVTVNGVEFDIRSGESQR